MNSYGDGTLFLETLLNTFFIGMIPTVVIVLWIQVRLAKNHSAGDVISESLKSKNSSPSSDITLVGDNQNESLTLKISDFFFAQAEGNYVEIRYAENQDLKKVVLRSTLTNIESQLSAHEEIKRVHRKYLANFNNVSKVSGNAQGYKLHYHEDAKSVPVSRQKSKELFS